MNSIRIHKKNHSFVLGHGAAKGGLAKRRRATGGNDEKSNWNREWSSTA